MSKHAITVTINGVLASELEGLKGAPLTRLLLLYCLVSEGLPTW